MRLSRLFILVVFTLCTAGLFGAGDWPTWRGPEGNGVSPEKNLPLNWSATDNIVWKLDMPTWSGSTPIVWGNRIFLNVAEGGARQTRQRGRRRRGGPPQQEAQQPEETSSTPDSDELALWCIDAANGKLLWKRPLGGGNHQEMKQNMSSPSPVTDGKHVWTITGTGILAAFDFEGKQVWQRDIQADYGSFGLNWGYASSPLLHEGTLYVQVLHGMKTDDPSYVLGIEASSGKTIWKVERPTDAIMESPDAYTTPMLLRYQGKTEIVVSGGDYVTGHDPKTGRELWRAGGLNPNKARNYRIVASPVIGDGIFFVPTRVRPLQAFRAGGEGDITESNRLWQSDSGSDVPTPVSDGTYLYVVGDRGVVYCLKAQTGEAVWGPERIQPGTYSSSPVLADGKIYATSEDGLTTVLQAGPEFKVLAENPLDGYTLASPAISDGHIFIRTENALYCIGE